MPRNRRRSQKSFFNASPEEIQEAREGTLQHSALFDVPMFRMHTEGTPAAFYALMWFVGVNFLGLVFVAVRAVVLWVTAGFKLSA